MSCSAFLMCIYTSTSHECPPHTLQHIQIPQYIHVPHTYLHTQVHITHLNTYRYLNTYIHRYTPQHIHKYLSTHIHLHIHTCTCHTYIPIHSTAYDTHIHTQSPREKAYRKWQARNTKSHIKANPS